MKRRPDHISRTHARSRRGTVYPLVLIVTAAGAAAALTGLAMRQSAAERQQTVNDLADARLLARTGVEAAAALIAEDTAWRSKVGASVTWSTSLDPGRYTIIATDETDSDLSDDDEDPVTITVTGEAGGARATLRATLTLPEDDAYRDRALALSPVAYWPLDDSWGSWSVAPIAGSVWGGYSSSYVSGRATGYDGGDAPDFDDDDTVAYIPHNDIMLLDDGTVMCHFMVENDRWGRDQTIIAKDARGGNGRGSMRVYLSDPGLTVRVRLESPSGTIDEAIGTVDEDDWHHVAITFGQRGFHAYLDGAREYIDGTFNTGMGPKAGGSGNTHTLTAGLWYDGDSFEEELEGSVRDIVFIGRQLSDREMNELVNPKLQILHLEPENWAWVVD